MGRGYLRAGGETARLAAMPEAKPKQRLEKLLDRSRQGCQSSEAELQAELLEIGSKLAQRPARRERIDREDLEQQGRLFALEAARRYRPEGRLDFWRFLLFKVRQWLSEWCARQRALCGQYLHLPRSVWRDLSRMHRAEARLPVPETEAVARESRLPRRRVEELQGLKELKGDRSSVPPDPLEEVVGRERAEVALRALGDLTPAQRRALQDPRRRGKALAKLSVHPEVRRLEQDSPRAA